MQRPLICFFLILIGGTLVISGCRTPQADDDVMLIPTVASPFGAEDATTAIPEQSDTPESANIDISSTGGGPVGKYLLGTNVPAWLNPDRLQESNFHARSRTAGVTLIRMPGGSWSNHYDWLACEREGRGIDDEAVCFWPWAARPSDFIRFLQNVPAEAMYTVNGNGSAQEAAALVAFFNGLPDDDTRIGTDRFGRDWGTAGQWAALRLEQGFPDPVNIKYWEIGNEIYGGKAGSGTDCLTNGWEEVWTCDGIEYVNGIAGHDGFRDFYAAMKEVDPAILIGAVGTIDQDEWSDWGNEVLAEAGELMDFYVMHHYAFFTPPADEREILRYPQRAWPRFMRDFRQAVESLAGGRDIPVAVTEYNLISFQDQDNAQLMTRAVNALYMADTIGQFMEQGIVIANQWALANGQADNGTDYGLLNADTSSLYPQYFAYYLWSHFGEQWLPVTSTYRAETTLSVYAGLRADGTYTVLAINKSDESITAPIWLDGQERIWRGEANVMRTETLDDQQVTFNGVLDPAGDLANAPALPLEEAGAFTFPPYSITLLELEE